MSVTNLRPNIDHWSERVDMAATFRWTARLNMHEAVANHFSLAVNDDGTQFLDRFVMDPVELHIRGGRDRAGYPYFVSMGATGQVPGSVFLNTVLPMNQDWLSVFVSGAFNGPNLQQFLGSLDTVSGEATARLDLSPFTPVDPLFVGLRITFCSFVWDDYGSLTGAASNPVDVFLR